MRAHLQGLVSTVLIVLATSAAAQDMPCASTVRDFVENLGIPFSDLADKDMRPQFWPAEGNLPPKVSGYWFSARPASCQTGTLHVSLWENCSVADAFTDGDCHVEGLNPYAP